LLRSFNTSALLFIIVSFLTINISAKEYNLDFLTREENQWLTKYGDSIRLAPDPDFEPIEIKGSNDELTGIAGDYIKLVEKELGLSFKVVWYNNWAENVIEAEKGNVDVWSAVVKTERRSKYMNFTKTLLELQPVFIVSNKININLSLETVNDKRLGVVEGWYHYDLIIKKYPHIKIKTYKSLKEGLIALQNGKVEVFISDTIEATYLVQKLGLDNLYIGKNISLSSKGLRIASRKDLPLLNSILEKTIAQISEVSKKEIYNKWITINTKNVNNLSINDTQNIFLLIIIISFFIMLYLLIRFRKSMGILIPFLILFGTLLFIFFHLYYDSDFTTRVGLSKSEQDWLNSLDSPLRVAPDAHYAPVEWVDDDGIFKGISIDYLHLIEKKLNIKFNIVKIMNWTENVKSAEERKFDIWSAVGAVPERKKYMIFTKPYLPLKSTLIVNDSDKRNLKINSIKKEKVAVVKNYFTHNYLLKKYPEMNLLPVDNIQEALQLLAFRKVDAVFSDLLTATYFIRKQGIAFLKISEIININHKLSIASRSDWPILNNILQKAMNSITKKESEQIIKKWVDTPVKENLNKFQIIKYIVFMFIIILIVILWNFFLKHLIKLKTKELKETQDKLKNSKDYMQNIINSMPSVLIAINNEYKITHWNIKASNETSFKFEDALGACIYDIFEYFNKYSKIIKNVIDNNKIDFILNQKEERNNKVYYFDITVYPLTMDNIKGAVIRIDDITEKKELEIQLNQSRKLDAIGQLAGGIAHDFNNILTGIISSAQLIRNTDVKDEDINKLLDIIITSSERASGLTGKLLKFARKDDIKLELIDVHSVIDDTFFILQQTIDKKILITLEKNAEYFTINGDSNELQNIFINMGINSSHAISGVGEIKISTKNVFLDNNYCQMSSFELKEGNYIQIIIEDTGKGISSKNINQIFNPFFTTKKQGEGTGLGLASVYGTVKKYFGEIKVSSVVKKGTRFDIFIPCLNENYKEKKIINEIEFKNNKGTILLADDEEIIRTTEEMILKKMGYNVFLASDGVEAINIFKEEYNKIDIVILDMIMPRMNGYETFFKMKEIDSKCKVLISSGYANSTDIDDLKNSGISGFIKKPFTINKLNQVLNEIFNEK